MADGFINPVASDFACIDPFVVAGKVTHQAVAAISCWRAFYPDHRSLVIEESEIQRFGPYAFRRDYEQLAVARLAKGPLEFSSSR